MFPPAFIQKNFANRIDSLVDFSMEIPAVATSYCLLMGIAVAQSFPNKS